MKKLNKIKSLLEKNHNFKGINYIYFPKTRNELIELIESLINKYGNKEETFSNCNKFNGDISKWDVSNGVYFHYMFYECKSFNADLSKWDVSNAKYWTDFATYSLLEEFPERIPERFRKDYLK